MTEKKLRKIIFEEVERALERKLTGHPELDQQTDLKGRFYATEQDIAQLFEETNDSGDS